MGKLNAWQSVVEWCTLKEDSSAPIPPTIPKLDEWLKEREVMTKLLEHHLIRIKQRMKSQADKKRTERQFQIGDKVYLRLQPYIQSFVASLSNYKLSFRYYGPFEIEDRVGTVAYRLKLPPSSMIHPVFHVSQLKKVVREDRPVESHLPLEPLAYQAPEQVLARRWCRQGATPFSQVLVRWTGMPNSLPTWENLLDIQRSFPSAPAWGQAVTEGGGIVTDPSRPTGTEDLNQEHKNRGVELEPRRSKRESSTIR